MLLDYSEKVNDRSVFEHMPVIVEIWLLVRSIFIRWSHRISIYKNYGLFQLLDKPKGRYFLYLYKRNVVVSIVRISLLSFMLLFRSLGYLIKCLIWNLIWHVTLYTIICEWQICFSCCYMLSQHMFDHNYTISNWRYT